MRSVSAEEASEAKQIHEQSKSDAESEQEEDHERSKVELVKIGLLCEALNGEDARSVKQAILFERSEFNRL